MHAHLPELTISLDAIDRVLALARREGLDLLTFGELSPVSRVESSYERRHYIRSVRIAPSQSRGP